MLGFCYSGSMLGFREKVLSAIRRVPKGRVVSYGQVAAAVGSARAARQVGGVLRGLSIDNNKVPWWRVINNQGVISIKGNWTANKELQASILKKEGVKIGKDFTVDMKKYRFLL